MNYIISNVVNALDPPIYREKGSIGRPDADPRASF